MDITGKVLPPCADIGTNQGWDLRQVTTSNLVIHSDTTDGSTTFADAVGTHTPAVGAADVAHDTAQKKWGKTSILFDGDSGYLEVPDHADFNLASGEWTIDFWVRFAALVTDASYAFWYLSDDADSRFYGSFTEGADIFQVVIGDNAGPTFLNYSWSPVIDTWYHVAVIRGWAGGANTIAVCIDGKSIGTPQTYALAVPDLADDLQIGAAGAAGFLNGWMDEFRWDKGTARWTADFIPPYGAYC